MRNPGKYNSAYSMNKMFLLHDMFFLEIMNWFTWFTSMVYYDTMLWCYVTILWYDVRCYVTMLWYDVVCYVTMCYVMNDDMFYVICFYIVTSWSMFIDIESHDKNKFLRYEIRQVKIVVSYWLATRAGLKRYVPWFELDWTGRLHYSMLNGLFHGLSR